MKVSIYQVDSFTSVPFKGNPAGVCILPESASERWMQNLAAEMNCSETAFLHPIDDDYSLRWFTPESEVDLCGHATLASAHILWETGGLMAHSSARFHTRSGLLTATRKDGWIETDFPAEKAQEAPAPAGLLEGLGVDAVFVGRNRMDYLVELPSADCVRSLKPDMRILDTVQTRGIIITSRSDSHEYDFMSRFFCPGIGIDEDPVTGSAHCALAPYWAQRLGKSDMVGYQASARGGVVRVKDAGARVIISGQAITVFRGEIVQ